MVQFLQSTKNLEGLKTVSAKIQAGYRHADALVEVLPLDNLESLSLWVSPRAPAQRRPGAVHRDNAISAFVDVINQSTPTPLRNLHVALEEQNYTSLVPAAVLGSLPECLVYTGVPRCSLSLSVPSIDPRDEGETQQALCRLGKLCITKLHLEISIHLSSAGIEAVLPRLQVLQVTRGKAHAQYRENSLCRA